MRTTTVADQTLAQRVAAILAQSSREPGVSDMLELMRIGGEAQQVQQMQAEMATAVFVTHSAGTCIPTSR